MNPSSPPRVKKPLNKGTGPSRKLLKSRIRESIGPRIYDTILARPNRRKQSLGDIIRAYKAKHVGTAGANSVNQKLSHDDNANVRLPVEECRVFGSLPDLWVSNAARKVVVGAGAPMPAYPGRHFLPVSASISP
jgi:hypothetical protein